MARRRRWGRWQGWVVGLVLAGAVGFSLFKNNPATMGQTYLAALDASHASVRAAAMVIDYSPDETAVNQAEKEIVEDGEGDPADGAVGAAPDVDRHWIRTADATFSWRAGAAGLTVRTALPQATEVLAAAVARGPLDDAAERACVEEELRTLKGMSDEALLVAWLQADRGVLAEMNDRTAAVREALLLLAPGGEGPVLTWTASSGAVYMLPETPTNDAQWCTLACFDKAGKCVWNGRLRVKRGEAAERVRTLAAMFAREAG